VLQVVDFIEFITASFMIDLFQATTSGLWSMFAAHFFTKLSTEIVGELRGCGKP
jgi:hypothetical protein